MVCRPDLVCQGILSSLRGSPPPGTGHTQPVLLPPGRQWGRGNTADRFGFLTASGVVAHSAQLLLPISPLPLVLAPLPRHPGMSTPHPLPGAADRAGRWAGSPWRLAQDLLWQGALDWADGMGPRAGMEGRPGAGRAVAYWGQDSGVVTAMGWGLGQL